MGNVNIADTSISARFEAALQCHKADQLNEAASLYQEILSIDPDHADSIHLLGLIAYQSKQFDVAFERMSRAIHLQPEAAHYRSNLGNVLREQGLYPEALVQHRTAARLRPESAEIRSNMATALIDLNRLPEALEAYREAVRLAPDVYAYRYNEANVLSKLGRYHEAMLIYKLILEQQPEYADAHYGLGGALLGINDLTAAVSAYREAIRLRPDFSQAYNDLGAALQKLDDLPNATLCFAWAKSLDPSFTDAHYNLGCALYAQNKIDESILSYEEALRVSPRYGAAHFALCMAQLPMLYMTDAEIPRRRDAYQKHLHELISYADTPGNEATLAASVGSSQPFFLAYQGQDDKELQALHGALACQIMAHQYPPASMAARPHKNEKIRIGIVSGFFHRHTVWSLLLQGWLSRIDRSRFSIHCYHTGTKHDAVTACATELSDKFVEMLGSAENWRETIVEDAPHILLYPEIGMDPMAAHLASQRLARVQCVSWGHPVTTGMPTIDYFLSSDAMEPANAEAHYTEKLIRFPRLACWYEQGPLPSASASRSEFGLRASATVYWSGQALYKYLPQYDDVFPRIAREVGDCQFIFIAFARSEYVTQCFRDRLFKRFADYGLDPEYHCVVLSSLPHERFIAAAGQADIALDTLGWSGGKSTLDILDQDLPIVTLPGPFMRGRHTAAMFELMGIRDTIADGLDEYVATAVALAKDGRKRAELRQRIHDRKHVLYNDQAYIAALEEFILKAVDGGDDSKAMFDVSVSAGT